jgi:hypothetical protein
MGNEIESVCLAEHKNGTSFCKLPQGHEGPHKEGNRYRFWWDEPDEDIFDKEFIESLGFTVKKDDGQYGQASCSRNGMTVLHWNRSGHHCTYFGDPVVDYNCCFSVKKDGYTRCAFNGYVFSRDDVERILRMTW